MELDVLGLFSACSYALDCVEAELVHVTSKHAKRVAYMSVCVAEQMGIQGKELQDLAVCALLHDNALTQYIQEELHNDIARASAAQEFPRLGAHCSMGEHNIQGLPFHTDVTNVILYHHENADGTGSFGKNGRKRLFLHVLFICVTCWMWPAAPRPLLPPPGKRPSIFFKKQRDACSMRNV